MDLTDKLRKRHVHALGNVFENGPEHPLQSDRGAVPVNPETPPFGNEFIRLLQGAGIKHMAEEIVRLNFNIDRQSLPLPRRLSPDG